MTKIAHAYDPHNGAYVGAVPCSPDPLETGGWLVPGHATVEAPPEVPAGHAAVWGGDAWIVVPDHRGTAYDTATGRAVTVTGLGALAPGLTTKAPATPWAYWDAERESWRTDSDAKRAALWSTVRAERDARLSACDWTQLPDSPLSTAERSAWADYRQALRDITESTPDPAAVVWPAAPSPV